jgi:hypothetical protein
MALTLTTNARNGACNGVVDLIDAGVGTTGGVLMIGTAAMATTLVSNMFAATAFGNAATGVATAAAISDGTAVAAGTAAAAKIVDKAATDVITGLTVATSGANINLTNTTIAINDVVSITSMTVTMPAS